jgi:ParE toxin of type II toxin-antitoxin system, parDE
VATLVIAPAAAGDLDLLIRELELPPNARARVRTRLSRLADFPESGEELTGRWRGFRYTLGPWRWMLIVFAYDKDADQVNIVTIQDSRAAQSATSHR